jgi:hypothetical protein
MRTDSTSPACANKAVRSSSVVSNDRFPTYSFLLNCFYLFICRELRELCGKVT